jgi:hypothetical protein
MVDIPPFECIVRKLKNQPISYKRKRPASGMGCSETGSFYSVSRPMSRANRGNCWENGWAGAIIS